MKNVVCIIQARMGSSRLPGKALMDICGKPMLQHIIERTACSRLIKKIVVATTGKAEDEAICALCGNIGIEAFRGDENDVLDRYFQCAKLYSADAIVRITGDCPLADPAIIDGVIKYFLDNDLDYASNAYPEATYPDGLDVEVFSFKALEAAWRDACLPSEREHVTPYIWNNKKRAFSLGAVKCDTDLSGKRWTVDDKADAEFILRIYDNLYCGNRLFGMNDILDLLRKKPELEEINRGTTRNEGYIRSIVNERRKR